MPPQVAALLAVVALAVVLFSFEWLSADVAALGVLLLLVLTGLLPAERAFAGFGSDTVMLLLGLLILTAALLRTGAVEILGRAALRHTGGDPQRLLLLTMVSAAAVSAFLSNTAATAFFLPLVVGVAARAQVSPSRFLLPLAFASVLSSSVTLVSTSTNLVVRGLMTRQGLAPIGMFELAPVGVPIAVLGLAYLWLVGRRLVPERALPGPLTAEFGLGPYLSEVLVREGSPLVGRTLGDSGLGRDLDLAVIALVRGKERWLSPSASQRLEAGDILLVEGERQEILRVKDTKGIDIRPEVTLADPDLESEETRLVEAILLPRSPLIGRTLKRARFRERYGLNVLAIHRAGETLRRKLSEVTLRLGDVVLLQGARSNIAALEDDQVFRVLGAVDGGRLSPRRALRAAVLFVGSLAAGAAGLLPMAVAALLGALLAFLTRCVTPEEAYREVEWKVIILVGSMLGLGAAMEHTGTARYLAEGLVAVAGTADPRLLLAGFFLLTVALTQPMSNQAAAALVVPVAIGTARELGLDPRPFAIMVAVAASCSYLTPLEPACLIVYAPGRYRFLDFVKVGAPLTVLIFLAALLLVPAVWPLS